VERVGRVRLLIISNASIALAQLLLGLSFSLGHVVPLALGGQMLFMAAFSIGVGPCAMMVASELFPLQIRGFALGVATLINRVTSGTVALSFLSLSRWLTPAGAYYLFALLALCATAFVRRHVPETKGKSLEEIEREIAEQYLPTQELLASSSVAASVGRSSARCRVAAEESPNVDEAPAATEMMDAMAAHCASDEPGQPHALEHTLPMRTAPV